MRPVFAAGGFKRDQPQPFPKMCNTWSGWRFIIPDDGKGTVTGRHALFLALRQLKGQAPDFVLASNLKK
jgi:hypothetical protein